MKQKNEPAAVGKRTGPGSRQDDYITIPRDVFIELMLKAYKAMNEIAMYQAGGNDD